MGSNDLLFPYKKDDQYDFHNEQKLSQEDLMVESLANEAIEKFGVKVKYLVATVGDVDQILGEDRDTSYNTACEMRMLCSAVDGWDQDEMLFNKFGIHDSIDTSFWIVMKVFKEKTGFDPKPGDVIHYVDADKMFEVTFTQDEEPFIQHGRRMIWKLVTKAFQYSGETIATGNVDIDAINGLTELSATEDGAQVEIEAPAIIDFDAEDNPFSTIS